MCFSRSICAKIVILWVAIFHSSFAASQNRLSVSVDSFSYSDSFSLHQWSNGLEGSPPEGGEFAFSFNQLALGFSLGSRASLSIFQRISYRFGYTPDTAELYYRKENGIPVEQNRTYDLELDVQHYEASGINVSYALLNDSNKRFSLGLNYLNARTLTDGKIQGNLSATGNSFSGQADVDYNYTEDVLFDRPVMPSQGRGYSVDVEGFFKISPTLSVNGSLNDLWGRIYWDDITYTQAAINSNSISLNPNGTIQVQPILSGIEAERNHVQKLALRANLSVNYLMSATSTAHFIVNRYEHFNSPSLAATFSNNIFGGEVYVDYSWVTNAATIKYHSNYVTLGLTSDSVDFKKARTLGLQVAVSVPF